MTLIWPDQLDGLGRPSLTCLDLNKYEGLIHTQIPPEKKALECLNPSDFSAVGWDGFGSKIGT